MKEKGRLKGVGSVDFWNGNEEVVPSDLKQLVYHQYYSTETLYVYCDTSAQSGRSTMAVACSYVYNTSVTVKVKYVYPNRIVADKNVFGELHALLFALKHIHQYDGSCSSIVLYSDVDHIDALLTKSTRFKHPELEKIQNELIALYMEKIFQYLHKDICIVYLSPELRRHNPFHKSAHNAAKRLLTYSR